MNDDLRITDDQLRQATSRLLPSNAQLEGDTAAARDAFLAFGTTIDSVASNFDQAALLARLEKSCVAAAIVITRRKETPREWLSLVLTGALAAAGLIAIVRIAADSQTSVVTITQPDNQPQTPAVIAAGEASPGRPKFAWNDPLDDEIAVASATIEQFTSRSRGFDDSLLDMNDQLQALSQELLKETL